MYTFIHILINETHEKNHTCINTYYNPEPWTVFLTHSHCFAYFGCPDICVHTHTWWCTQVNIERAGEAWSDGAMERWRVGARAYIIIYGTKNITGKTRNTLWNKRTYSCKKTNRAYQESTASNLRPRNSTQFFPPQRLCFLFFQVPFALQNHVCRGNKLPALSISARVLRSQGPSKKRKKKMLRVSAVCVYCIV